VGAAPPAEGGAPRCIALWRPHSGDPHSGDLHSGLDDTDTLEDLGFVSEVLNALSPALLRRWLEHRLQQLEGCELGEDSIGQNTRWLAEWLGLSEAQRKVLAFGATVEARTAVAVCLVPFKRLSSSRLIQLLSDVLGEPSEDICASLSPRSPLVRSGMVQFRPDGDMRHGYWIGLESPFDAAFAAHYERPDELFSTVCPRASEPELALDAFAHLARDVELLSRGL
jgi:hypothetical protein